MRWHQLTVAGPWDFHGLFKERMVPAANTLLPQQSGCPVALAEMQLRACNCCEQDCTLTRKVLSRQQVVESSQDDVCHEAGQHQYQQRLHKQRQPLRHSFIPIRNTTPTRLSRPACIFHSRGGPLGCSRDCSRHKAYRGRKYSAGTCTTSSPACAPHGTKDCLGRVGPAVASARWMRPGLAWAICVLGRARGLQSCG